MAYNEEANIGHLLGAVLNQQFQQCQLSQIVVVASGCTDKTVEIAKAYARQDSRLEVIVQPERKGKASAINLFLEQAKEEILLVESGDTIPSLDCYEALLFPFLDPQVGMTGARPVPVNDPRTFMGFCVHFLWQLHHGLACKYPKLGELIAFRNLIRQIPEDTAVDEASIEQIITGLHYKLCYAPQAIVYNKGPETLSDFIKQRRRIANGHMHLKQSKGYAPSTTSLPHTFSVMGSRLNCHLMRIARVARRQKPILLSGYLFREAKRAAWVIGAVGLETLARFLGWYDLHVQHKNPVSWEVISTTKRLNK
jgi:biofilm PGA synthesis N-glycosyltransferase PgaC